LAVLIWLDCEYTGFPLKQFSFNPISLRIILSGLDAEIWTQHWSVKWDTSMSQRWIWELGCFRTWRRVVWYRSTNFSDKPAAYFRFISDSSFKPLSDPHLLPCFPLLPSPHRHVFNHNLYFLILYCHDFSDYRRGLDWWSDLLDSLIQRVTTLYSSLLHTHIHTHTSVHSHVFTRCCLVAASNGRRSPSLGFPKYPSASAIIL
jgi:hypothetical protein